ncbi:hypothetical protein Srot_0802 [Segniliparus rotundus DSM 44985]|uniref:Uncharacterized protein n=1 Tax=Segniliparus rotundus (strain ATCC BAA-972 / CDC 1076 / CIP 108378 / DSM 44985 / JCM 13578) TaxID=640132 RepID=D6ZE01_SEGRD|nr:hypothetical protein [Segniliparus rotundus]ADG97281.1 hypothetical protein Srot_0802 [Segniliparus rotundus DSM 44985]
MAGFTITDYDEVIPGLDPGDLPVDAKLMREIPGSDRPDYVLAFLQKPLKYRTSDTAVLGRAQAEFLGEDGDGAFVRIYAVVVASRIAGMQLHKGMRAFPVNIALVIDNTLSQDEEVDFSKLKAAGIVLVDDWQDEAAPEPSHRDTTSEESSEKVERATRATVLPLVVLLGGWLVAVLLGRASNYALSATIAFFTPPATVLSSIVPLLRALAARKHATSRAEKWKVRTALAVSLAILVGGGAFCVFVMGVLIAWQNDLVNGR